MSSILRPDLVCLCYVRLKGTQFLFLGQYFCFFVEPVGTRPPKFLSNVKLTSFEERQLNDVAMLCQAQGYPSPTFR